MEATPIDIVQKQRARIIATMNYEHEKNEEMKREREEQKRKMEHQTRRTR